MPEPLTCGTNQRLDSMGINLGQSNGLKLIQYGTKPILGFFHLAISTHASFIPNGPRTLEPSSRIRHFWGSRNIKVNGYMVVCYSYVLDVQYINGSSLAVALLTNQAFRIRIYYLRLCFVSLRPPYNPITEKRGPRCPSLEKTNVGRYYTAFWLTCDRR